MGIAGSLHPLSSRPIPGLSDVLGHQQIGRRWSDVTEHQPGCTGPRKLPLKPLQVWKERRLGGRQKSRLRAEWVAPGLILLDPGVQVFRWPRDHLGHGSRLFCLMEPFGSLLKLRDPFSEKCFQMHKIKSISLQWKPIILKWLLKC